MKTNIGIETSDESREKIARTLGLKEKLVSRKALSDAVMAYVQELIDGKVHGESSGIGADSNTDPDNASSALVLDTGGERPNSGSLSDFKPSRGDESYLFKARDAELHARLSNLLDAVEGLEDYTWTKMEENRT